MDFTMSERQREWLGRVQSFMNTHVRPAVPIYRKQDEEGPRWIVSGNGPIGRRGIDRERHHAPGHDHAGSTCQSLILPAAKRTVANPSADGGGKAAGRDPDAGRRRK